MAQKNMSLVHMDQNNHALTYLSQHNVSHTPQNHPKHESVSSMDQIISFGLLGSMDQILSFGLLSNMDQTRGSHYTFGLV